MTATQAAPQDDVRQLEHLVDAVTRLRAQVAQRIVGQDEVVDGILTAILAGGHALFWVGLAAYGVLWVVTAARCARHWQAVRADLASHARAPGFFTVVAASFRAVG